MEYIKLGKTGLKVSRIALGTMTFGDPETTKRPWLLNQSQSDLVIKKALDLGINFFDTAIFYSKGQAEQYLGESLKKYAKRENVIIGTKIFINDGFLSREAILREVDASLKRLQTDYIDLLTVARWDYTTPIEETLSTLHELIKAKKVRFIGCSSIFPYQLLRAQETSRKNGWETFTVIQNLYNLIYREEEREMIQLLEEEGIVMTPYSPLASGALTRLSMEETVRGKNDFMGKQLFERNKANDEPVKLRIKEIADKKGSSMAQISLAWLLSKELVVSPIISVTKVEHLEDAVKAVKVKLSQEEIKYLEELYKPHQITGPFTKQQFEQFIPSIKKVFG